VLTLSLTLALFGNLGPEPVPATTELNDQIEVVLETPEPAEVAELERIIHELEARPLVLLSNKTIAKRLLRARVIVAWAQREPRRAAAAMDEALRSAAGRELPLSGLGTELVDLAEQRMAMLQSGGTANIEVACAVACELLIDERRSTNPTAPLLLGTYRVWVVSNDGQVEPLRTDVELDAAGEIRRIEFGQALPLPPPPEIVLPPQSEEEFPEAPAEPQWKRKRSGATMLPLWVEIVGVVAGAGLIATGAGLLTMDGKCKGGGDPTTCPTLFETTAPGAALSALGSATLLSFSSVLGLDRAQIGKHVRSGASIGWTFRF
jgi:hypothetical protein